MVLLRREVARFHLQCPAMSPFLAPGLGGSKPQKEPISNCSRIAKYHWRRENMATIRLTCPACARMLEVGADAAGKEVECGECLEVFIAKAPESKIRGRPRHRERVSPTESSKKNCINHIIEIEGNCLIIGNFFIKNFFKIINYFFLLFIKIIKFIEVLRVFKIR